MALGTYVELQNTLADFLNRTDLTDAIKVFIALGEADIRTDLRSRGVILKSDLSINDGDVALPTNVKAVRSLYDSYGEIRLVAPEQIAFLRQRFPTGGVRADYAAIVGTDPTNIHALSLLAAPIPQAAVTATIIYEPELTPLDDGNAANWLLTMHPNVYLYASLKHSAPYLRDDERLPLWDKLYADAIAKLTRLRDDLEFGAGPLVAMPRCAL